MGFEVNIKGRIELPGLLPDDATKLAAGVASALIKVHAANVSRLGNSVTFDGGALLFAWSWNILASIGPGTIDVLPGVPGVVAYKFSCLRLLTVATVMSLFMASFFWLSPGAPLSLRLGMPILAWLWLYGGNYFVSLVRLHNFLRKVVVDAKIDGIPASLSKR